MDEVHVNQFQLSALAFCDKCMLKHKYRKFTSGFPVPNSYQGYFNIHANDRWHKKQFKFKLNTENKVM